MGGGASKGPKRGSPKKQQGAGTEHRDVAVDLAASSQQPLFPREPARRRRLYLVTPTKISKVPAGGI